jgi:TonB-linked SusC/RagA family outer membrane protein
MQALTASPTIPVYDENGDPYFNATDVTEGLGWLFNPLTVLNKDNYSDDRKKANLMANNYIEYKIVDGLVLKSSIGINYNASTIKLWRSNAVPRYGSLNYPSTAGVTNINELSWLNENTLSYKHLFNENHSLDALIGFTAQKDSYERLSAGATDFPSNYVTYLYAGIVNAGTHLLSEWSMMSLLGRVNYSYDGKYLFTATIRRDGCSRFGSNHKWGTFPSFSLGYNISEESFMQSLPAISNLKVRASYGFAGNNQIGNYTTIGLLSASNYVENDTETPGLVPSNLSNDDLTWEKSKQIDLGIELGLFDDRISLVADIYKNTKKDLLLNVELPAASGFNSSTQNIGDIENKGFEVALQTSNIKSRNFNWTSDFVFSHNENKVLRLATEGAMISVNDFQITKVGYPISSFYLLNALGIFQNEEEVASNPIQHEKVQPGDIKFEDVTGDGTITTADKKIIGDPWPDFTWGFNNRFTWKNLSLYVAVIGSHGGHTYFRAGQLFMTLSGVQNQLASMTDRWKSEDQPYDGMNPRAIRSGYAYSTQANSRLLFDNSYIKVKDISLSYTLPKKLTEKLYMSNLTIFADIANAFTFTDYPGYDPEASSTGNEITQSGIDYLTYPTTRVYTIGLNLSF